MLPANTTFEKQSRKVKWQIYGEAADADTYTITIPARIPAGKEFWNFQDEKIQFWAAERGLKIDRINHAGRTFHVSEQECVG